MVASPKPILLDLPVTVETPRLILRVPHAGDSRAVYEALLDGYEDYVRWLNWPPQPPTKEMVEEECRRHHAFFILRTEIRYLVILKETQKVIGRVAFPPFQADWAARAFGISYFIRASERRQGYAREAVEALIEVAFKYLHAERVEIWVDEENIASLGVPRSLGFLCEYRGPGKWQHPDGSFPTLLKYVLSQ